MTFTHWTATWLREDRPDLPFSSAAAAPARIGTAPRPPSRWRVRRANLASLFSLQGMRRRHEPPITINLQPLTEADFDKLVAWVRHRPLFERWSHGQMRYPLDREQLEDRFEPAAPDSTRQETPEHGGDEQGLLRFLASPVKPAHLAYKAVLSETNEMVGVVELANIDHERARANVELARSIPRGTTAPHSAGCWSARSCGRRSGGRGCNGCGRSSRAWRPKRSGASAGRHFTTSTTRRA